MTQSHNRYLTLELRNWTKHANRMIRMIEVPLNNHRLNKCQFMNTNKGFHQWNREMVREMVKTIKSHYNKSYKRQSILALI